MAKITSLWVVVDPKPTSEVGSVCFHAKSFEELLAKVGVATEIEWGPFNTKNVTLYLEEQEALEDAVGRINRVRPITMERLRALVQEFLEPHGPEPVSFNTVTTALFQAVRECIVDAEQFEEFLGQINQAMMDRNTEQGLIGAQNVDAVRRPRDFYRYENDH